MKKISTKQRERDKKIALHHRCGRQCLRNKSYQKPNNGDSRGAESWNEADWQSKFLHIDKKRQITLALPEIMNFSGEYDSTVLCVRAIRQLSETSGHKRNSYRLKTVNFDNLRTISTSAALVLTAELSKWDDAVRQRLRPMVDNWDVNILEKFSDLGFFELFDKSQDNNSQGERDSGTSVVRQVKYIKGRCGDSKKTRTLREALTKAVGDEINKWTFLRCGLDEAITNVSHHAYPSERGFAERDKNWYLTGSFNKSTKELKIVFYDQGIGIPKSLPASKIWERVLKALSMFPAADRKADEVLLKAAVDLDRTSTGQSDRGKGLQDLLEFIRQLQNGYLSIMSSKGLFKYSIKDGVESTKSFHFERAILGTLIIWSVNL